MDPNLLVSAGSTAVLSAYVLQYLKHAEWFPWLGIEKIHDRANLVASIIAASVGAVGIGWTYDAHTGSLMIVGLTMANVQHFAAHWIGQWCAQHAAYKSLVCTPELLGRLLTLWLQNAGTVPPAEK